MLVGVKFCGGCNPRYDRGEAFSAVKRRCEGAAARFEYAEEAREYDLLLYIAGCVNRCTALDAYKAAKGVVCLWDGARVDSVSARIEDISRG
jgi:hypothetical protein